MPQLTHPLSNCVNKSMTMFPGLLFVSESQSYAVYGDVAIGVCKKASSFERYSYQFLASNWGLSMLDLVKHVSAGFLPIIFLLA
jgi:hypothetical protein